MLARALGTPANHLTRIDIDDGRVNFKIIDEKLPFALTRFRGLSSRSHRGDGKLQLEAAPWRSGVALQTAGTVFVRGDVAGTSARLQPAEFHLHWSEESLADLLRLFRGRDYGIRGEFALDATAKSGSDPLRRRRHRMATGPTSYRRARRRFIDGILRSDRTIHR